MLQLFEEYEPLESFTIRRDLEWCIQDVMAEMSRVLLEMVNKTVLVPKVAFIFDFLRRFFPTNDGMMVPIGIKLQLFYVALLYQALPGSDKKEQIEAEIKRVRAIALDAMVNQMLIMKHESSAGYENYVSCIAQFYPQEVVDALFKAIPKFLETAAIVTCDSDDFSLNWIALRVVHELCSSSVQENVLIGYRACLDVADGILVRMRDLTLNENEKCPANVKGGHSVEFLLKECPNAFFRIHIESLRWMRCLVDFLVDFNVRPFVHDVKPKDIVQKCLMKIDCSSPMFYYILEVCITQFLSAIRVTASLGEPDGVALYPKGYMVVLNLFLEHMPSRKINKEKLCLTSLKTVYMDNGKYVITGV